jgi:hypothetical protein
MKAISIRQPWASLIVAGIKDIENRSWITHYRGKVLVHAAQKFDKKGYDQLKKMGVPETIIKAMGEYAGGIIGEVEIVDCVKKSDSPWFEGPFGFVLTNAKVLKFKPCKGKLGIFDISDEDLQSK